MQIGVPNRKIHENVKLTWLLYRLHEYMNKNINSHKATALFKKYRNARYILHFRSILDLNENAHISLHGS